MAGRGNTHTAGGPAGHIPVLATEVVQALKPAEGAIYIDGTFGAGGYTRLLLDHTDCSVIGIDRDPDAIAAGQNLVSRYGGRLKLVQSPFSEIEVVAQEHGAVPCDGICLDIGVSSMQLDQAERGFSFMADGPLDMRMAQSGKSAADIVNSYAPERLADIFYQLGEERMSRRIARSIADHRTEQPITRTGELAQLIERVLGRQEGRKHPATRCFQALRMYVNGELQQLAAALVGAERILREGARLAVVTFHSIEDRIVKKFMQARSGQRAQASRHQPALADGPPASFKLTPRKAIKPSPDEIAANPRARSAQLRVAERTDAAPFTFDLATFGLPPIVMENAA